MLKRLTFAIFKVLQRERFNQLNIATLYQKGDSKRGAVKIVFLSHEVFAFFPNLGRRMACVNWSRGVAVSTQDSESCDGSSNLPGTFRFCLFSTLH